MIQSDLGGHVSKIEDQPWPAFPADTMSTTIVRVARSHTWVGPRIAPATTNIG